MILCLNCGPDKTYIYKTRKGTLYTRWYNYKNGKICSKCRLIIIDNPRTGPIYNPAKNKKWNPINVPKLLKFKNRRIVLKENPRKGICQLCGAVKGIDCKQTQIHHFAEYHDDDPLKDTIELCARCHHKETWKNRISN